MLTVLGLDPGETTGWSIFLKGEGIGTRGYRLLDYGIFRMWSEVESLIQTKQPDIIAMEAFRLYPWKAKHKTWSGFPEVEVIGVIKYLGEKYGLPVIEQGANSKTFFTDERLKEWGFYVPVIHSRDAVRHALYYLEFGTHAKA